MIFGEHCTWQRDGDEDPKNRCQARRVSERASGLGGEAQCEELFGDVRGTVIAGPEPVRVHGPPG